MMVWNWDFLAWSRCPSNQPGTKSATEKLGNWDWNGNFLVDYEDVSPLLCGCCCLVPCHFPCRCCCCCCFVSQLLRCIHTTNMYILLCYVYNLPAANIFSRSCLYRETQRPLVICWGLWYLMIPFPADPPRNTKHLQNHYSHTVSSSFVHFSYCFSSQLLFAIRLVSLYALCIRITNWNLTKKTWNSFSNLCRKTNQILFYFFLPISFNICFVFNIIRCRFSSLALSLCSLSANKWKSFC